MTAPHTESDDRAILTAHDKRLFNAGVSLDRAVAAFKLKARREHLDRLLNAAIGYHDEYVAGLERVAGKPEGSFERLRPPAVEAWEDGPPPRPPSLAEPLGKVNLPLSLDVCPRPQNDFGRSA